MSRTQFSLRSLLAAIGAVGVGAALWMAEPSWQVGAGAAFLLVFLPAAALTLAVHSTGIAKTWWTGLAVSTAFTSIFLLIRSAMLLAYDSAIVVTLWADLMGFAGALSYNFRSALVCWAFSPIVGLLCVFTHWLLIRPLQGPQD
jgi:hypothetical protein